jgi:hypothetical protein
MNFSAKIVQTNDSTENHCSRFREIAGQITALAAAVDIRIVPYFSESLEHFSKLDSSDRQNILNSLEIYLNVYQAVYNEGASLLDSHRVIWNALAQLKYRPTSDLFTYVNSGNVIEIHDTNFVQVFRNLAFFRYCSYSLEELYCFKLQELYARDEIFENRLMSYIKQIFAGIKTVIKTDLKHTIRELASKERLEILDDAEYMAPLFSMDGGNHVVAFITIENAKIKNPENFSFLSKKPTSREENATVYSFKHSESSGDSETSI